MLSPYAERTRTYITEDEAPHGQITCGDLAVPGTPGRGHVSATTIPNRRDGHSGKSPSSTGSTSASRYRRKEGNVLFNNALNTFYDVREDHSESKRKPAAATWATLSD